MHQQSRSHRERLVAHVQDLERLEAVKKLAADDFKAGMQRAKQEGFDPTTLKVVLKLRKMTSSQRRERKALEAIYMAALGMLEGDPLPDEARRRLDPAPEPQDTSETAETTGDDVTDASGPASTSPQPTLPLKTAEEARSEGRAAAAAGQRIYDNPYPAGDPCRAAWDEGWCAQSQSHGMETPAAYRRRNTKPSKPDQPDGEDEDGGQGGVE